MSLFLTSPPILLKSTSLFLTVLEAATLLIPQIDLYVHTDILLSAFTLAQLVSSLVDYQDIMGSMKEGILVIHLEETAPDHVGEIRLQHPIGLGLLLLRPITHSHLLII